MNAIVNKLLFFPPTPPKQDECDKYKNITHKVFVNLKYETTLLYFNTKKDKKTIILSHGNNTNIYQMVCFAKILSDEIDVNVLLYEYVGYNPYDFEKVSTDEKLVQDSITAAYKFLHDQNKIPNSDIIIFGISVGCAPTIYLASKYNFYAMIIQSPFTDPASVKIPFVSYFIDIFNNIKLIADVKTPTYILHGKEDNVINYSHSESLSRALPKKYLIRFLLIDKAGHNDLIDTMQERYYREINIFLLNVGERLKLEKFNEVNIIENVKEKSSGYFSSSHEDSL